MEEGVSTSSVLSVFLQMAWKASRNPSGKRLCKSLLLVHSWASLRNCRPMEKADFNTEKVSSAEQKPCLPLCTERIPKRLCWVPFIE